MIPSVNPLTTASFSYRPSWRVVVSIATAFCFSTLPAEAAKPSGWAVASAHPLATEAAHKIAAQGGNAFDAAVAVTAALSVVEPMGSGIGGGGFWLLHRAEDGFETMVDGRERAPLKAHRDMYLNENGEVIPNASLDGVLAAGIPGEPAALAHIARKYGRMDLAVSLQPAITLARAGFPVGPRFQRLAGFRAPAFNKKARALFLTGEKVPDLGTLITQPELGSTLTEMAHRGHDGFYTGWVASTLVSEITTAGGIWTQQDLSDYKIVERPPIRGVYRQAKFVSASPPSSGGVVLAQMLNMLQAMQVWRESHASRVHFTVEAMRRAYRDRALYLGDPDFVEVNQAKLTSPEYAWQQIKDITDRATDSESISRAANEDSEGDNTSHFSIIDAEGNRVAATLSINYPFGSGFVSAATGVVLNNEMDDFVSKPGVANVYGLVGGRANAIEPGKRPLSSMSPTFIETDDFIAAIGTPGGSRIITMVLLGLLELVDRNERDIEKVVNVPRFHHQFLPDYITYEATAFDAATISELRARGHELKARERPYGDMHAVLWVLGTNKLTAASDGRGEGSAMVWYTEPED